MAVVTGSAGASWREEIAGSLQATGVRQVDLASWPDLVIVLGVGEPPRDLLDDLVRQDTTHLMLTARATVGVEIGPLVQPGLTACHRCVDAHRGEQDPRRPVVVEQVARIVDTLGDEPLDPLLTGLASAWAVRDALRHLEGDQPCTWSTSWEVGPREAPLPHAWRRHPHCGCAWNEARLSG